MQSSTKSVDTPNKTRPQGGDTGQGCPRVSLSKLLAQLEIPLCKCGDPTETTEENPYILCRHVAESDHGLPLERWQALLWQANPSLYATPPGPLQPTRTLSKKARIEVYRNRLIAGHHWQHPEDLRPDEVDHMGKTVRRRRNGSLEEVELRRAQQWTN